MRTGAQCISISINGKTKSWRFVCTPIERRETGATAPSHSDCVLNPVKTGNSFFYSLANRQRDCLERSLPNSTRELRSLFVKELCGITIDVSPLFSKMSIRKKHLNFLIVDILIAALAINASSHSLFVPSQQPFYITQRPQPRDNRIHVQCIYS